MENILDSNHFLTQSEVNKFLMATLLCGLIGAEREFRSKQAGLKTMIMIGLGSTLFTILSIKIGLSSHDRIASNIVTGIGFLGAGVIFKEDNQVKGLTTACVIWIVAAIGMAIGSGFYEQAVGVTLVVLLALLIFPFLEEMAERRFTKRIYRIVKRYEGESLEKYEEDIKTSKLKLSRGKQELANGIISGTWIAIGSPKNHKTFVDRMLQDKNIIAFDF
ncbi:MULTISPECIES: MgtC/SapB family protein [Pedobacter]|uniref:MgtC/SapB transporter n=1 Tax=Pedobacter heparinus (strain ATCC 13125 / DSM 2366 / CIP 104194 / JCM 7457 / NBRC 12017 / NCIMB 9290 / NRRL B-14731 / HIM 762-3) TaxID=485917 RepID=C6XYY4_PEDHD|nr:MULTISPECIES: MgtC/SapB family protein [Pedobacter]ACU02466.1 MgtC/SapB transporter [Pedobacter heparinus DSM 2366]MBB5440152.1 putative Mg2+ transporter-C (MgtC) family protein [Pedobacter sp. AK017]